MELILHAGYTPHEDISMWQGGEWIYARTWCCEATPVMRRDPMRWTCPECMISLQAKGEWAVTDFNMWMTVDDMSLSWAYEVKEWVALWTGLDPSDFELEFEDDVKSLRV